MNKIYLNYYCKCGNKVSSQSALYGTGRCRECFCKSQLKGDKSKIKYYCKDCNKRIHPHTALYKGGRCHSCACKYLWKTSKKMQNQNLKGKNNPNFGNHKLAGKNNPMFGKKHSPETIEKMRKNKLDRYEKDDNPNWKGGIGRLPYTHDFYKIRPIIWERDHHTCQKCFRIILKNTIELRLSVHHIDYNKENCLDTNLISLCNKCNSESNANRDYWYAYFTYILTEGLLI